MRSPFDDALAFKALIRTISQKHVTYTSNPQRRSVNPSEVLNPIEAQGAGAFWQLFAFQLVPPMSETGRQADCRLCADSRSKAAIPLTTPLRTFVRARIVAVSANWHVCAVEIYKIKLPAGLSYVLKPSLLEGAILDAGIQLPVSLHQQHKVWAVNAPALSADFYPRGSHIGGDAGHFSVTSCAIPSNERKIQQDFAERIFLPSLVAWMTSIEVLPPDSTIRREEQFFACEGAPMALAKRALPTSPKGKRRRKRA